MKINQASGQIKKYAIAHKKRKQWLTAVTCMAAVVVFCTVYALILPAITLEKDVYCGITEHTHDSECCEKVLICGLEESEPEDLHRHGEDCYELVLRCEQPEHAHSLACCSNPDADVETAEDWEKTLSDVELSGDWAEDLPAIARTQLGYKESEANYQVLRTGDGETVMGYTRYGAWYGDPYGDWSAMFAAFCLNYAEIPAKDFPREASCSNWVTLLHSDDWKLYHSSEEDYTPNPGDLVFFDWDQDGEADRMGIVAALSAEEADKLSASDREKALDGTIQALTATDSLPEGSEVPAANGSETLTAEGIEAASEEVISTEGADESPVLENAGITTADETEIPAGDNAEGSADENIEVAEEETYITLITIEGNSGNMVQTLAYSLEDETILGYGQLPLSDYQSIYDAMAEILDELKALNPADDEEAQALCLDAYLRLGDLLDPAYDACDAGRITEEELSSLEALYEEALVYMLNAYGFDPYGSSFAAYTETDVTVRAYVSEYHPEQSNTINGYARTLISDTASPAEGETAPVVLANSTNRKNCLIPVSWLLEQYGAYGYTFDETNPGTSPFVSFASTVDGTVNDAYAASTAMVTTIYVQENGIWYVRVTAGASGSAVNGYSLYYTVLEKATDTVTPSSTVIHLFDYWATANRTDSDNHAVSSNPSEMENGINTGHLLKFGKNMGSDYGMLNYSWGGTNTPSRVTQEIVDNTLGTDGYPYLSGKSYTGSYLSNELPADESLAYLFDPTFSMDGKASFTNVSGLLWRDEQGYYCYDCTQRAAELNEATHAITEYTTPAAYYSSSAANSTGFGYGQFFPFNSAQQSALLQVTNDPMNHYFGMSMTTRFIQEHDGYTNGAKTTPMTFEFSGDNDVWIFIDGVLVADLGGLRSAASVSINFVTGEVTINDNYGATGGATTGTPSTTIKAAFDAAGKDTTGFSGNTFANNTTHTLKFYYLERGNYDSNLKLTFNLTEIPPTSIYKVDQYGNKLTGAVFAVYRAAKEGSTYKYILDAKDESGNTQTGAWQAGWYAHPESGKVYASETAYKNGEAPLITPAYCDVTDTSGDMVFVDADDAPYTMAELRDMFGDHFILREVHIPEGYRTVTDEVYLYTDGSIIFCEDPYKTGVWASPNAMVTATNRLYRVSDHSAIEYYDVANAASSGTLFAVVLKRNGESIDNVDSWYPVYGNDEKGYTVLDTSGIGSVIEAAWAAQDYGDTTFKYSASGMQVTLENLPGKPERYYTYMQQQNDGKLLTENTEYVQTHVTAGDPQYFVAYYWTEETLDRATADNTYRVISRDGILNGQQVTTTDEDGNTTTGTEPDYSGFSIQWGTTIEVPNLENRLFVQKLDTAGELVNGATFALYEVYDATPTTESGISYGYNYIYYNGTDKDGKAVWVGLLDNSATPQPRRAIVFGRNADDSAYVLGRGYYDTNKTTGEITVTLDQPNEANGAKENDKYFVRPAVNANGDPLIATTHDECAYVKEKGTGHFDHLKSGKYYLREIAAPAGYTENTAEVPVLVNDNGVYANAGTRDNDVAVGNGVGYLTKTLDVFASAGEIDETLTWVYGALIENDAKDFSAFDAVSGDVIYVGDGTEKDPWYFVTQAATAPDGYGTGESLDRGRAMVTYLYYDGALASTQTSSALFDYTPNADQSARTAVKKSDGTEVTPPAGWISTVGGEGTRRLYTDTGWSDMAVYQDYAYGFAQTSTNATTNYDIITDYGNISNLFSSSTFVQVTDRRAADLVVKKVDMANENTTLSGAQFRLSRTVTKTVETAETTETTEPAEAPETKTVTEYYACDSAGVVSWVEDESQAAVVTTETDGLGKVFSSLEDGSYYLEESRAPDGYNLLAAAVEIKITGGNVTLPNAGTSGISVDGGALDGDANRYVYTITVPNSSGYELPETGGTGTKWFINGGLLLMTAAVGCTYRLKRRRERRAE